MTPGFALKSDGSLAVIYMGMLCYMFVGISIISDIFMDSINVITSAKRIISERDQNGNINKREV